MKLGKILHHLMSPQLIKFRTLRYIELSLRTFIEDTAIVCINGYSRRSNILLSYWYAEFKHHGAE
jgi:hypothetical protein